MTIRIKKWVEGVEVGVDNFENKQIERIIREYRKVKAEEEKIKIRKKELDAFIDNFHLSTGAKTFVVDSVGEVNAYYGTNTRTDQNRFTKKLIDHGVSAVVINDALDYATTTKVNNKITIKFKAL